MDMENKICGRMPGEWLESVPVMKDILGLRETAWTNPDKRTVEEAAAAASGYGLSLESVLDAEERLRRFAPYFMQAFPETKATGGLLESPLKEISSMKTALEKESGCRIPGRLLLKLDSHLAVSGSIKARGGIYEVLKFAEETAAGHGLLEEADDYSVFNSGKFRDLFSGYSVSVGSTGNLGLSIGIIGAALGFKATVHMSKDARKWKKDMLRSRGVEVIEYESDYSEAVRRGREQAKGDPHCHFVDDENSRDLFLGYSAAALRLKGQLADAGIAVDREHPLFVYLPCGVGGGPGGVAFGLKQVYGDNVHCFFAEPVHSCCMLLGMATGMDNGVSVQDFGLDNRTAADGLAVGRASGFVGRLMRPFMSGCYTLSDERMLHMLSRLADTEGIYLEPSALAGMYGPVILESADGFAEYVRREGLERYLGDSVQLVWATGGSMVPEEELLGYYREGKTACCSA